MQLKKEYTDEVSKQTLIDTYADLILIEEQNITEGNFLIFTDSIPVSQLLALSNKVSALEEDGLDVSMILLDSLLKSEVI